MIYTEEVIQLTWEKGTCVGDNDSSIWRKDECGAWIQRSMYGDRTSPYGWEIDSTNPIDPEQISNLQPLHWKNSIGRGTGNLICRITANGIDNKEIVSEVQS
jgi:hypothetical protein